MHFVDLGLEDAVPDTTTIWLFGRRRSGPG
jgi:hypothetical protein